MPFLDYNLWATWQALYDLDAEPYQTTPGRGHVRLSYHRAVLGPGKPLTAGNAQAYIDKLGWTPAKKIAALGCGFGWTIEELVTQHGFSAGNLVGADVSTFIQTNKGGTEEADINAAITAVGLSPLVGEGATVKGRLFDGGPRSRVTVLNEDGRTPQSRTRLRQALTSGTFDIAFSEDVLGNLTDAEAAAFSAILHQIAPAVQHLVTMISDGVVAAGNWKTIEQWKALLPNDTFLSAGDYRVL